MANHIVLIAEDLMIAPRLEASVRRAGYVPLFATDEASLVRAMVNAPVLVIADLAATSFNWRKLVRLVKGPGKKNNHVPVLGFGPHVDLALRDEALAAGCTAVVGRSAVSANLPALIKKHLWH
ncbi:MAG: hypothetical protein ACE5G8_17430, partial [Anaerolineae bacterium]